MTRPGDSEAVRRSLYCAIRGNSKPVVLLEIHLSDGRNVLGLLRPTGLLSLLGMKNSETLSTTAHFSFRQNRDPCKWKLISFGSFRRWRRGRIQFFPIFFEGIYLVFEEVDGRWDDISFAEKTVTDRI